MSHVFFFLFLVKYDILNNTHLSIFEIGSYVFTENLHIEVRASREKTQPQMSHWLLFKQSAFVETDLRQCYK